MDKLRVKLKHFWAEFKLFITSFFFLKNFAKMIGVLVFFFVLTNWWLNCYTRHGEVIALENFVGKPFNEVKEIAKKHDFNLEVIDSVWYPNKKPGIVTNQTPEADSPVKENRSIYITISKYEAPQIVLPLLGESSYDYNKYSRKLKREEVYTTIKDKIFDARQANNSIAYFYYKDEKVGDNDVKNGFKVSKGDTIHFVVTERTSNRVNIPNLVCMQNDAAKFLITGSNLNLGEIYEDGTVTNRASAYIWKQMPAYQPNRTLERNRQIDLYLTQDSPDGCQ